MDLVDIYVKIDRLLCRDMAILVSSFRSTGVAFYHVLSRFADKKRKGNIVETGFSGQRCFFLFRPCTRFDRMR